MASGLKLHASLNLKARVTGPRMVFMGWEYACQPDAGTLALALKPHASLNLKARDTGPTMVFMGWDYACQPDAGAGTLESGLKP